MSILAVLGRELASEILRAVADVGVDGLRAWLSDEQIEVLKNARRREKANKGRRDRARQRDVQALRSRTRSRRSKMPKDA